MPPQDRKRRYPHSMEHWLREILTRHPGFVTP